MRKLFQKLILFLLLPSVCAGCVRIALEVSPSLIPSFAQTLFEECDPDLAGKAIPANLKLLEGLLKSDPENKQILTALSMGFSGYSMLFVETANPESASELYLRARKYGIRALGESGRLPDDPATQVDHIRTALRGIDEKDFDALFWTTLSWIAWINLNLDKPVALAQLSLSQACLERIIELDGSFFHGLPHVLEGIIYAARPQVLGGNAEKGKSCFEEALKVSGRKFFLAQYYFARYYAVRIQNKKLFLELIEEIVRGNARDLEGVCLMNRVTQDKAADLKNRIDELFF